MREGEESGLSCCVSLRTYLIGPLPYSDVPPLFTPPSSFSLDPEPREREKLFCRIKAWQNRASAAMCLGRQGAGVGVVRRISSIRQSAAEAFFLRRSGASRKGGSVRG